MSNFMSISLEFSTVYNRSNPPELIRFEVLVEISYSGASERISTRKLRSSFELYLGHPERCSVKSTAGKQNSVSVSIVLLRPWKCPQTRLNTVRVGQVSRGIGGITNMLFQSF